MKDYLVYENNRNKLAADVQTELVHRAFGPCEVLVAHHITYEPDGMDAIEIPSADTLIFDHDIMGKIFGPDYIRIMKELVVANSDYREQIIRKELGKLGPYNG